MATLAFHVSCETYDIEDVRNPMSYDKEYASDHFEEAFLDFSRHVNDLYGSDNKKCITVHDDVGINIVMSAIVTNKWTVRIVHLLRVFTE